MTAEKQVGTGHVPFRSAVFFIFVSFRSVAVCTFALVWQFNWVCNDSWKPALAQSMFFVGSVLGSIGLGIMSDHVGRLPVLILANMLALVGNVATVFTKDLPEFAFCRMVNGLATDNNFVMMYIIGE